MMDLMFDEVNILNQKENAHLTEQNLQLILAIKRINDIVNKNLHSHEQILIVKNLTKNVLEDFKHV